MSSLWFHPPIFDRHFGISHKNTQRLLHFVWGCETQVIYDGGKRATVSSPNAVTFLFLIFLLQTFCANFPESDDFVPWVFSEGTVLLFSFILCDIFQFCAHVKCANFDGNIAIDAAKHINIIKSLP